MNANIFGMRTVRLLTVMGILLCCIVFSNPGLVYTQDLEVVNPSMDWSNPGYDYGNVAIGESRNVTFNFYSAGPSPVWVYVAGLCETDSDMTCISPGDSFDPQYALGAFSFDPMDGIWAGITPIPRESAVGEHLLIDVIFTPTSLANFDAYLYVASNDSVAMPGIQGFFHLQGTGVDGPAIPEPAPILLLGLGLLGVVGIKRRLR